MAEKLSWYFSDKDDGDIKYGPFTREKECRMWNSIHRNIGESESYVGVEGFSDHDMDYMLHGEGKDIYGVTFRSPESATYPKPQSNPAEWSGHHSDWVDFAQWRESRESGNELEEEEHKASRPASLSEQMHTASEVSSPLEQGEVTVRQHHRSTPSGRVTSVKRHQRHILRSRV